MRDIRRLNRHAEKRKHKRRLKQRYGKLYDNNATNLKLVEDRCREDPWLSRQDPRNGGYTYWHTYYLTGPRQYAKFCTNRAIRAMYRDMIRRLDEEAMEDIQAFRGADYEKAYDYAYTLW